MHQVVKIVSQSSTKTSRKYKVRVRALSWMVLTRDLGSCDTNSMRTDRATGYTNGRVCAWILGVLAGLVGDTQTGAESSRLGPEIICG